MFLAVARSALVKVFGCRQAYENRPSTNLRGCGEIYGDFGFRLLVMMAGAERRYCRRERGECGFASRDVRIGGRLDGKFVSVAAALTKGVCWGIGRNEGVAAWAECVPCRVTT